MDFQMRKFNEIDLEAVVQLSLLAWEPVFHSIEHILGPRIFTHFYPEWKADQRTAVEGVCRDTEKYSTWVAETHGAVVGFIAYFINHAENGGEIEMLAVHPGDQNRGIGTALNQFVLEKMREQGLPMAIVKTGGDPGHAPARRCYEKSGFTGLPIVYYYQKLTD